VVGGVAGWGFGRGPGGGGAWSNSGRWGMLGPVGRGRGSRLGVVDRGGVSVVVF